MELSERSKELISRIDTLTEDVQRSFGGLSAGQLNWKPDGETWSVGQCIDHLITSNNVYFEKIAPVVEGTHRPNVWARIPLWSSIVGYMLRKAVDPESAKKTKTFTVFEPRQSDIPETVVRDFRENQERLKKLIVDTDGLDRSSVVISSPVSERVPVRLSDAFEVLALHERRHFDQAVRVTGLAAFPPAERS